MVPLQTSWHTVKKLLPSSATPRCSGCWILRPFPLGLHLQPLIPLFHQHILGAGAQSRTSSFSFDKLGTGKVVRTWLATGPALKVVYFTNQQMNRLGRGYRDQQDKQNPLTAIALSFYNSYFS